MGWVFVCTATVTLIANLPLLYSCGYVHGWRGVAALWGFSPHQFLYCLLAFPFSAFGAFTSLHILLSRLGPRPELDSDGRWLIENWLAVLLLGLGLSSFVAVADYFGSARSLDKLQPMYAATAINALKDLNERVDAVKKADRDDIREKLIHDGRAEKANLSPPTSTDPATTSTWLTQLPPETAIQVIFDPHWQRRLRILNEPLYALSLIQVVVSIFVGFCALFSAAFCIHVIRAIPELQKTADLHAAVTSVSYGIFFFGLYPICYQQYRAEIEAFAGSGFTTLQQYFVAGLVLIVLSVLLALSFPTTAASGALIARVLPILVIGLGLDAERRGPQVLRRLIGIETNTGTQVILAILFMLIGIFMAFQIWPRRA